MSGQKIEMHFTEVMHLAEQLRSLAKALRSLSEVELMELVGGIKAGWNSECADILAGGEVRICEQITLEAEKINRIAGEMEEQAKKMYQYEMANSRLALIRIY